MEKKYFKMRNILFSFSNTFWTTYKIWTVLIEKMNENMFQFRMRKLLRERNNRRTENETI